MQEFRSQVAGNLVRLRQQAGLTQAELGAKINYSDKSVSKWERAEAVPDAFVLKQIADLYGVTVDYLLTPHAASEIMISDKAAPAVISYEAITAVVILGIFTMALVAFILLWLYDMIIWQIFVAAIPVALIALLVFHSLWGKGKYNMYIVMALVFSIVVTIYASFATIHPWQLFLLLIPAELIVFISFRIKIHPARRKVLHSDDV